MPAPVELLDPVVLPGPVVLDVVCPDDAPPPPLVFPPELLLPHATAKQATIPKAQVRIDSTPCRD
jgi:hypothetical protein